MGLLVLSKNNLQSVHLFTIRSIRQNLSFQFLSCLFGIFLLLSSCSRPNKPDISNIQIDFKFKRFEVDLFSLTNSNYKTQIDSLQKKYPILFPFYFEQIGGWKIDSGEAWKDSIWHYVQSSYSQALFDSTMQRFANLSSLEKELQTLLRNYKYYFPEKEVPDVNTLINGPPAFTVGNNLLCISLDKYLGPSSIFYHDEAEPLPQYLLMKFRPEYILPNSAEVLMTGNFGFSRAGKNLLDAMIYKGKIIYCKQKLLPDASDSIATGFREKDLKWCNENEPEIWKFFIEHKLLYNDDPLEYSKYVIDGPNTSGMPEDAPGNIGSWVGWRIVSQYLKKNPEITLEQLMNEQDSQKILTASRYKPTR